MPYKSYNYGIEQQPSQRLPTECSGKERLFIQPEANMTTLNSDNIMEVQTLDFNSDKIYSNQTLTGTANPRTLIANYN